MSIPCGLLESNSPGFLVRNEWNAIDKQFNKARGWVTTQREFWRRLSMHHQPRLLELEGAAESLLSRKFPGAEDYLQDVAIARNEDYLYLQAFDATLSQLNKEEKQITQSTRNAHNSVAEAYQRNWTIVATRLAQEDEAETQAKEYWTTCQLPDA
ncbi:hypothetical protein GOV07_01615 [Candidatus Woesearchaeota archaeon]|nr:hypothetical protein [Candidatus Woesearchaeota archaeon]